MSQNPHPFYQNAVTGFQAAVQAADPFAATQAHLPKFARPPLVIAVGKAATHMADAAYAGLGEMSGCIIVTNPENAADRPWATTFAASHPVPDQIGLAAGQAVIDAIEAAAPDCPILCLISGGGSALLPAPVAGVTLAEKAALNAALLASGADIVTMNMIRQQVSRLKGGGLARIAGARPMTALILSDVIGDDLRAIASGPTAAPIGTASDAKAALQELKIWDQLPNSIQAHLGAERDLGEVPKVENILIGSNGISQRAAADAIETANMVNPALEGDVKDAALRVASLGAGVHVLGGETTVILTGTGKGGRNQDLALRVALLAEVQNWSAPWLYLQAGTDGRDGPTDAAGGVVDENTLLKIRAAGLDPQVMLNNNDAYHALKAGDALLITGGTGTNVADIGILIRS